MARVPQLIVVDPDRESSAEMAKTLQMLGFQVLGTAGYGVEAFTLCFQMRPDLVLMRVEEPLVRPIQTLSRINDGLPDLPIVVFSTEANIRLMRQSMVGGASDYLQEPLNADELEASIMRVLEKKEREAHAPPRRARRPGRRRARSSRSSAPRAASARPRSPRTSRSRSPRKRTRRSRWSTWTPASATSRSRWTSRSNAPSPTSLGTWTTSTATRSSDYLVEHESGVRILPAPTRPSDWRNLSSHHIRDVVDVLAQTHDFVILDTPGTFNEIVAAAIEVGTMILLITTLDMASIKDTVLALEMLHERFGNDDERIKVVLNRAGIDTGVREKDVERTLDTDLWWKIPQDNEVVKAAQLGRPDRDEPAEQPRLHGDPEIARALAGIRQRSKAPKRTRWPGRSSSGRLFKKSA